MNFSHIGHLLWNFVRNRTFVTVLWIVVCVASMFVTNMLIGTLKEKETHYVKLWSYAMGRVGAIEDEPLVEEVIKNNQIPFIITDEYREVKYYHLVPDRVIDNPQSLSEKLEEYEDINDIIVVKLWDGGRFYIYYGESMILRMLKYIPWIQLVLFGILMLLGFFNYRMMSDSSQNRVWVGLAKETAHQLGTPISSLLGWIEYLRSQPIDQTVVDEMGKDVSHLQKITDRFSKIGSQTELTAVNVNETVGDCVMYFRQRIPRNVTIEYNGLAMAPVQAMVNTALFEWVIENLLKNSLDALQGKGHIAVIISTTNHWINIDVQDTGKGMPKSYFKKIFTPGFTTKTRGWGLGLSLSRRIVEEYHKGRIFVLDSEVGRGTTFRIQLKRI